MFNWIREAIRLFFSQLGLSGQFLSFVSAITTAAMLICAGVILYYIIRIILQNAIRIANKRFPSKWKTSLLKERFFIQLSFILPILIIRNLASEFFLQGTKSEIVFAAILNIFLILNVTLILIAFLRALCDILLQLEASKDKPIKSYVQIVSIIIWAISIILIVSILINKSPALFLTGLGGFTAILMLVFQDTIVGFVNSIQLSSNDLVRNGDWITVSKYDADGTVEEINLISVKVRNFDNTISTVPVRQLVTDTFQNWRGMEEQGVRRIKRSFFIDSSSIAKPTPEMLSKINLPQETNLGCFREYLAEYLKNRGDISTDSTLLIRLLPTNEFGVPVELYCFAKTIEWLDYEKIQAEVMEHVLVALPQFNLVHYQRK
ncbi:MAG: mechanosensitive ion channel family protein [Bacteroidetes bacterium]|nr:mechanosensitive ion channel family protein [Bacteroidota bacterium]MCL1968833.1 mechanosensitive ion channel family protein [Bacteroidota bacterium]